MVEQLIVITGAGASKDATRTAPLNERATGGPLSRSCSRTTEHPQHNDPDSDVGQRWCRIDAPIGTGAFAFKSFKRGERSLFVRNPLYKTPGGPAGRARNHFDNDPRRAAGGWANRRTDRCHDVCRCQAHSAGSG